MNDFLQSIRNGSYSKDNNRQRHNNQPKARRPYENSNGNYNNNRNNGNERKFRNRNETPANDEVLKGIKESLDMIVQNQLSALAISERRAVAEERKASAFEFIASKFGNESTDSHSETTNLSSMLKSEMPESSMNESPETGHETLSVKSYEIIKNDTRMLNKDDVLAMILSMRNDGSTYNEIASHLVSLDLPTFSGRGKWHAQTVHRLCQNL